MLETSNLIRIALTDSYYQINSFQHPYNNVLKYSTNENIYVMLKILLN